MEMQKLSAEGSRPERPGSEANTEAEKVLRLVLSGAGGAAIGDSGREEKPLQKRDWSSAIDLVNEACEAVRLAEERASTAERYSQQLNQYYAEQVRSLELRIQTAEKRAEAANARAAEAEEWLLRFHDAIVTGFKGVLDPR
jgi:predicted urease superfamily metal-dependent hydrolase